MLRKLCQGLLEMIEVVATMAEGDLRPDPPASAVRLHPEPEARLVVP